MRVYNKIGSKERLFEMFQGVNDVVINETKVIESTDILRLKFKELLSNLLDVKQANVQVVGDASNIELICIDKQNNQVVFKLNVTGTEDDQDGVYNITSAKLVEFIYTNKSKNINVEVDENGLTEFNNQHVDELVNVASDYTDFEGNPSAEEMDETYMDAVKKIDSYPFGGTDRTMKNSKNYIDNQPTNPKLRVKDDNLNKFVDEELNTDTDIIKTQYDKISQKSKKEYILTAKQLIDNNLEKNGINPSTVEYSTYRKMVKQLSIKLFGVKAASMNEENNYPKEIGKKFKTKKQYGTEKKKRDTTTNISEIDELEGFKAMNVGSVVETEHPLSEIINIDGNEESLPKTDKKGVNRAKENLA